MRSSMFVVKYSKNPRRTDSRFAVVVSKKVLKSAVGRNRVRRRLYEVIRHELPKLKSSHDAVVMVFSAEVRSMPHQQLRGVITQLLAQASLYK